MDHPMRLETIVAVFRDRQAAEEAVAGLEQAGFTNEEVGFLTRGGETDPRNDYGKKVIGTTGAAVGAGALAGGVLAALAAGLIPGVGPVLGGGALLALIGASTGGAGGGVAGMLFSSSAAEDPRMNYSEFLKEGRTVVTVTGARSEVARPILERHGAEFASQPAVNEPPTASQL